MCKEVKIYCDHHYFKITGNADYYEQWLKENEDRWREKASREYIKEDEESHCGHLIVRDGNTVSSKFYDSGLLIKAIVDDLICNGYYDLKEHKFIDWDFNLVIERRS